jgi:arsenate reductase
MSEVVVYHNPRCSKSRATLELLKQRGIEPRVVEYLSDPLSAAELEDLAVKLGRPASEWIRAKEDAFAAAGLGPESTEAEVLAAIEQHPILMERPIVVRGDRAAIGRPPENVLEIL